VQRLTRGSATTAWQPSPPLPPPTFDVKTGFCVLAKSGVEAGSVRLCCFFFLWGFVSVMKAVPSMQDPLRIVR
jgi:hypothetical protein